MFDFVFFFLLDFVARDLSGLNSKWCFFFFFFFCVKAVLKFCCSSSFEFNLNRCIYFVCLLFRFFFPTRTSSRSCVSKEEINVPCTCLVISVSVFLSFMVNLVY